MKNFITSESVSSGHPDKICDQISDAILDACLAQDPMSRVGCETMVTTGTAIVSGEITTKAVVNYNEIVRKTICEIGYDNPESSFDGNEIGVHLLINTQSPDIAAGVDTGGAGDQGIMYGYATNESDNYLPLPINLAHKLARRLEEVRKNKILDYLLPDGKTQVTVEYEDNKIIRVDTIVISNQHKKYISQEDLKKGIKKEVIDFVVGDLIDSDTKIFINPTGIFEIGGPKGDCGLTGRKIIIDTYGGVGRHGGGAFSGKDPTKVDRSGAYIARYLAKNIVASGICDKCEIQLGYAIGVAKPVSIYVDCFGTEKVSREKIINTINSEFDLSPAGIIKKLDLRRPIYQKTATYGHFGRDDVSWEELDSKDLFSKLI
ncbi:MAG: methionine adenosyltransferase [Candidatus Gracilibacteria bacterium]|nr:methionine adenosyltransferase [Candidatus Gracilibacteria bacterium]